MSVSGRYPGRVSDLDPPAPYPALATPRYAIPMGILDKSRRTGRALPLRRTLPCPLVGHQASWCRFLCEPIEERGICGRLAPHSMQDRTQRAIARHQASRPGKGA